MERTEWLLKKLDKDAGEELVYVLAEFVYFDYECVSICVPRWLHVYAGDECVCVFLCITPGSTSYHCFIMEECQGSFITEPGCFGDLGAMGPCSKGPHDGKKLTELKRG